MELFSTQKMVERESKRAEIENARLIEIRSAIAKETSALNKIIEQKKKVVADFDNTFSATWEEKTKQKAALEVEIIALGKRREALKEPLDTYKQELEERHKQIILLEQQQTNNRVLLKKQADIFAQEIKELQQDQRDVQYQKELNDKQANELVAYRKKLDAERQGLLERMEIFEKEKAEFYKMRDEEEAEILKEKTSLVAKKDIIRQQQEDIETAKTRIKSDRAALDAAKKEIYGRS